MIYRAQYCGDMMSHLKDKWAVIVMDNPKSKYVKACFEDTNKMLSMFFTGYKVDEFKNYVELEFEGNVKRGRTSKKAAKAETA